MEILYSVLRNGSSSVYYHRTPTPTTTATATATPTPSPTPPPPPPPPPRPPSLSTLKTLHPQTPHHSREYTATIYGQPQFLYAQLRRTSDDAYLAQHRFPTPPITPPPPPPPLPSQVAPCARATAATTPYSTTLEMKVGQGQRLISSSNNSSNNSGNSSGNHETDIETVTSSESSTPSTEYICHWSDCGSYFDSLASLAAHVNQMHAVPLPDGLYYCRWLGCQRSERGFNARYKMLVHVRTHTKEKPHSCHLCKKSFSRAENLKIHIRSHSGEKPYVCTYEGCTKAYSNSSDRFKHTRTHAVEKPYVCKVAGCQKRYTDPSSLRKHVKTFKHGMQLINVQHHKVSGCDNESKSAHRETQSASPISSSNMHYHRPLSSYDLYAAYSAPAVSHLYVPADVPDVTKHLEYYYETDNAKRGYWPHGPHIALDYPENYGVNMELSSLAIDAPLDLPLDLRTNRK